MNKPYRLGVSMRLLHRYLGFLLAGIMTVYAVSGMLLVLRDTDFLKKEIAYEKKLTPNLSEKELGKALEKRRLEIEKSENGILYFKQGTYNQKTGIANYKQKELPKILDVFLKFHKSSSKENLGGLNLFFGLSLLFFVISSFWMFRPKSKNFKKGMIYTAIGILISVVLLYVS